MFRLKKQYSIDAASLPQLDVLTVAEGISELNGLIQTLGAGNEDKRMQRTLVVRYKELKANKALGRAHLFHRRHPSLSPPVSRFWLAKRSQDHEIRLTPSDNELTLTERPICKQTSAVITRTVHNRLCCYFNK